MKRVGEVLITVECDCGHQSTILYTNEEWENSVYLTGYEGDDFVVGVTCQKCGKKDDISLLY